MTSFAFIIGVLPLVVATGAGAASRQAIGTAVCFGMLGVTMLGVFFTPPMYVLMQKFKRNRDGYTDSELHNTRAVEFGKRKLACSVIPVLESNFRL